MLIDSHCHLHDKEFFTAEEAEKCLVCAREMGVEKIVCIGTDHEDSLVARDFAQAHENVYWTYGIHPENANQISTKSVLSSVKFTESVENVSIGVFRSAAARDLAPAARGDGPAGRGPNGNISTDAKLVAIGEVGLDYHYEGYDRKAQIHLFEEMLQLATDNDLPVSFHIREAFDDFFPVVANFPKIHGVVHSFTDSKKTLRRILSETEFYIGVNGLATYSTLPLPPLEKILLETDAPFLAPVPHRGETNESSFVPNIANWLAERLGESVEIIARETSKNTSKLFHI